MNIKKHAISRDPWQNLAQFTPARIALGRAGTSLPTEASLEFQLAHALARDAVKIPLDFGNLEYRLKKQGYGCLLLQTQAESHRTFLQRPDLGRLLSEPAMESLKHMSQNNCDAVVVVADGLSSKAIENHAEPFLGLLLPKLSAKNFALPPVCLVKHGRVAIGDVIAGLFAARLCIVLVGERPGLSSPDSMGIYFTFKPRTSVTTDADRNCISNIHHNGLSYTEALNKLLYLIDEAEKLQLSGIPLKDETINAVLDKQQGQTDFLLGNPFRYLSD